MPARFFSQRFSLYLRPVWHFSFSIKVKKPKPRKQIPSEPIQVPSVFELAQIAMQIAQLPTEHTRDFSFLAGLAFEMWDECQKVRNERIGVIQAAMNVNSPENFKLLKKQISFPIALDDFLVLMMPKKKPAERLAFYREFVRNSIRSFNFVRAYFPNGKQFEDVPLPSDSEVSEQLEIHSVHGFQAFAYKTTSESFREWLSAYEAQMRKTRASKGGIAKKANQDAADETK